MQESIDLARLLSLAKELGSFDLSRLAQSLLDQQANLDKCGRLGE